MNRLPNQFIEDRALRDAARGVLKADIAHARAAFSGKSIASRIAGRIGDGAQDVVEVAKTNAENNRGILAILLGAVVLFFAREPILEILGLGPENDAVNDDSGNDDDSDAQEDAAALDQEQPDNADLEPTIETHAAPERDAVGDDYDR